MRSLKGFNVSVKLLQNFQEKAFETFHEMPEEINEFFYSNYYDWFQQIIFYGRIN